MQANESDSATANSDEDFSAWGVSYLLPGGDLQLSYNISEIDYESKCINRGFENLDYSNKENLTLEQENFQTLTAKNVDYQQETIELKDQIKNFFSGSLIPSEAIRSKRMPQQIPYSLPV